jgi:hypothetical protein
VLLKVAKEIRRMNRLKAPKKPSEPKLKILWYNYLNLIKTFICFH